MTDFNLEKLFETSRIFMFIKEVLIFVNKIIFPLIIKIFVFYILYKISKILYDNSEDIKKYFKSSLDNLDKKR